MTCEEAAKRVNVSLPLARKWAAKNNVKRVEVSGGILAYDWSEEDLQRFLNRPTKRGRPWPEKNKREN